MVSHLFFYQLMFLGLLWLCVILHYAWPNECTGGDQRPSKSLPSRKRSSDPKPFPGLTRKPSCAACEQAHEHGPQPPGCPPPRMAPTRGRPRQVDTSVVKKSAPAITPQCARKNVCHAVGRRGTGGSPCRFSIRAIVERPTRWPTFFSAPCIRV